MSTAPVVDLAGASQGELELPETVFAVIPHATVMHQALLRQLANARQGTHDSKTRTEVSGGGRKPYRQKGTGRARQGSIRAPHYAGGGTVFGPTPRDAQPSDAAQAAPAGAAQRAERQGRRGPDHDPRRHRRSRSPGPRW